MINQKLFLSLQNWFDNYINNYSFTNLEDKQNIDLKYKHTYKVCEEITDIANSLSLEKGELYIAKTIALFHDLGRFEQYIRYKTFSDTKSEDHAKLGVSILLNNKVLTEIKNSISQLILKAISYHNKATLPEKETEEGLFYTKLIRDADKLDIWRVVLNKYNGISQNTMIGSEVINNDYISDYIYKQIMDEKAIEYDKLETLSDLKLLQMGWIYDINFERSFQIIQERNYVDKLFNTIPKSKKAIKAYSKIKSYLKEQV